MRRVNSFLIILFITLILSNTIFAQEVEKPNPASIKDTTIANEYFRIADSLMADSKYDSSLDYFEKAIILQKEILGEEHSDLAKSYHSIGIIYYYKSKYSIALEYWFKELSIKKYLFGDNSIEIASNYSNIGSVYNSKGECDLALEYHFKALNIDKQLLGEKNKSIADDYNSIGSVYSTKLNYNLSLEYFFKSLKIRKELFGERDVSVGDSYHNIGTVYSNKLEYNLALEYYLKALDIYKELFGENNFYLADSYSNIGSLYDETLEYDLAIEYYLKAISISKDQLGKKNAITAMRFNNIALVYWNKSEYNSALLFHQKALCANVKSFSDSTNIFTNPLLLDYLDNKEFIISIFGKADIFEVLAHMGGSNLIKPSQLSKSDYLQYAYQNYMIIDKAVEKSRKIINTQNDKIAFGKTVARYYPKAARVCLSLAKIDSINKANLIDKAFYFSEQNKSMVLATSLAKANALQFAGLPDSLIQKEKSLKNEIASYTQKLAEQPDSAKEVLFRNKLFDLNREYEKLTSLFENDFPEYYELMHNKETVSVKQLQSILEENTAFVEYFTGDSTTYIFTITKTEFTVKSVSIDFTFTKSVENIITTLKTGEFYDFSKESNNLYKTLIEPISNEIAGSKKLVIVPDGIMNKIPFEILFEANKKKNYLINNFEISYSPSASLYYNAKSGKENVKKTNYANLNFLGCAPVFAKGDRNGVIAENTLRSLDTLTRSSITDLRGTLLELPFSKDEINNVSNLFNGRGKILLDDEATETNFKNIINNNSYNFVHISTHGLANEESPELSCLSFSQPKDSLSKEDGFLYSGETYNLNLQGTDLLVLSACESGIGKIAKGEGMLSLTRGFLYAGANNILYSLWKINDKFTSEFMTLFYKKMIEEKQTYSSALREAKLEMIKKGVFPGLWASFVLVEN